MVVDVTDDDEQEPSETFVLTLRNAVNGTLDGRDQMLQVLGTINDDDENVAPVTCGSVRRGTHRAGDG